MLMIFVGPLVSQSMPMEHGASMPMEMDMGAGMHMDAGHHGDSHDGSASLHVMWEKCGYCSLFFHCPALPQQLSLLNSEPLATGSRLVVQPRQGHPRPAFFPGARSRAPPATSIA